MHETWFTIRAFLKLGATVAVWFVICAIIAQQSRYAELKEEDQKLAKKVRIASIEFYAPGHIEAVEAKRQAELAAEEEEEENY